MYQRIFAVYAFVVASTSTFASPGTRTRDWQLRDDQRWKEIWKLLEITPLASVPDKVLLRIWDGTANVSISVNADAVDVNVIRGDGDAWFSIVSEHYRKMEEQIPSAERMLEVKRSHFEFRDAALVEDIKYLLSRIAAFDSDAQGLDGGFTFIDAIDANGRFSTFEIWSPREDEQPLAFDLCHLHWTFVDLIRLCESSEEAWKSHEKINFMTRFPGATGVNLTPEKAMALVRSALKGRLQSLVAELRRKE